MSLRLGLFWRALGVAATMAALAATGPIAFSLSLRPAAISVPLVPGSTGPTAPQKPSGPGAYWLVASDGGIFSFGGVPFEGSTGAIRLNAPIAGMAATATGRGYWLVASDGGIFAFGDAAYLGSPAGLPPAARPTQPVVGIVATPDGNGYWVVTAGGAVYAFGDAGFAGSLAGLPLPSPVVGMAATPDGGGYWLATAAGGVYTFGDAGFAGSAGNIRLTKPIVAIAPSVDGGGYWLTASDGGIFSFGDAAFHGSTGAIKLNQPIVGMAASPTGGGYWLVASDGGIFAFGDAPFRGSTGGRRLNRPIVGLAVGHTLDPYPPNATGYDISWPQCGGAYPARPFAFAIVGVNDGRAFTHNPCLADEAGWAGAQLTVYMNLNSPPTGSPQGLNGPAGQCVGNDTGCIAYNYGYNAAVDSFSYATGAGASSAVWWLDVETSNTWDSNAHNNDRTIQGALDALGAEGVVAGIYSTSYQYGIIAGDFRPLVPTWVATGATYPSAVAACSASSSFGGGTPWLTQYGTQGVPYDQDFACPET